MKSTIKAWRDTEPVRLYLYALLTPASLLAIAYGLIDGQQAALWVGLATVALGVPATERARANVTPTPRAEQQPPRS